LSEEDRNIYFGEEDAKPLEPHIPTPQAAVIQWSKGQTPEVLREARKRKVIIDRERRESRRQGYEAAINEYLPKIAEIQAALLGMIEKARDPLTGEIDPTLIDTKTGKLLLDATDKILDRTLGKSTTKIEASISHSVVDELARLADEA
jgi:hypothetical protein